VTAAALAASGADRKPVVRQSRHDPTAPGALVLPRPDAELLKRFGSTYVPWPLGEKQSLSQPTTQRPRGYCRPEQVVDVVVDPYLASVLRPHQREGVRFMYECVMGMKSIAGQGAILADEMCVAPRRAQRARTMLTLILGDGGAAGAWARRCK
jgi:hypothetical protein